MGETEFDALLDGLPLGAILLEGDVPAAWNRRARALLPADDAGPLTGDGGAALPDELTALLPPGEEQTMAGVLELGGRQLRVTLSPAGPGRRLLCLTPQPPEPALSLDAVATQLRQALADLHLSTQRLGRVLQPLGDPSADRTYQVLHRAAYRLLRMARHLEAADLLARDGAEMEPLDLAELCAGLVGEAEVLTRNTGVELSYESPLITLPVVGSGPMLQLLVLNLLSNALKGAGRGGRVTLKLTRERGRAVVTVENTGAGPSDMASLFRPEQGEPAPGSGLGLGLVLAQRAAAAHRGSVLVLDTGAGARVTVALPLEQPDRDLPLRTPGLEGEGGFSTVLVELADVLPSDCFDYFDED